jgi:plastocyanin
VVAWLAAFAALGCGSDGGSTDINAPPTGGVTVANNTFTPSSLSAAVGSTVTWTWSSGGTQHNVTFEDGIASPIQGSGTYERTFTVAGSYPYHCAVHGSSMSGTVTVSASPGGGGGNGGGGGGGPYGTVGRVSSASGSQERNY